MKVNTQNKQTDEEVNCSTILNGTTVVLAENTDQTSPAQVFCDVSVVPETMGQGCAGTESVSSGTGQSSIRALAFWDEVDRLYELVLVRRKEIAKCRDSLPQSIPA